MIYKFLEFDKEKRFTVFPLSDPHIISSETVIKKRIERNRIIHRNKLHCFSQFFFVITLNYFVKHIDVKRNCYW
nr:MAG TPA: hypothetical protein [Bacteriophage sp.]